VPDEDRKSVTAIPLERFYRCRKHDSTFSRTVWRPYGGAKGLVMLYYRPVLRALALCGVIGVRQSPETTPRLDSFARLPRKSRAATSASSEAAASRMQARAPGRGVILLRAALPHSKRCRESLMKQSGAQENNRCING
jgi:hypothetical protein